MTPFAVWVAWGFFTVGSALFQAVVLAAAVVLGNYLVAAMAGAWFVVVFPWMLRIGDRDGRRAVAA